MNKRYLIYGVGALIISLLVYLNLASLTAKNVYSNNVAYRIEEGATVDDTKKDSINEESKDENMNSSSEEIIDESDDIIEVDEPHEEEEINTETSETEDLVQDIEEKAQESVEEDEGYEVVEAFESKMSMEFTSNIKYEKYPMDFSYIVVLSRVANIREKPSLEGKVLKQARRNEKINLSKTVKGQYLEKYDNGIWYKLYWEEQGETKYGYMLSSLGEARSFRVKEVEEVLSALKSEVDSNDTAYISNYKNVNGAAPHYKGKSVDEYGARRYQAAPGHISPDYESEFRYFPDGALLSVLEEKDDFIKVRTPNFSGEYWVPKKYVSFENSIEELSKIVVIDRKNQNETVFEYSEDKWTLVSYALATTGRKGSYRRETPLGYYMAIEKKPSFLYYKDGTKQIAGFAPHATRFTGGMYIHGIPTNFKYVEGKRVNPGAKETSSTIGTVPLSHGCVRNNTSHAKFLYDWLGIGETAIIVIDELPSEELSSLNWEEKIYKSKS